MDIPSGDVPKLPDMVMCGDHPSFTKTELNAKEVRPDDKDKPRDTPVTYARITPSSSRSEHEHRPAQPRRPALVRSLEAVPRIEPGTACVTNDRALLQGTEGRGTNSSAEQNAEGIALFF
ncbi:hypothetical protein evm_015436 [Chilo suppressalis]|nr:hypothetical protein evm_015436 [Chilo suppressalis]